MTEIGKCIHVIRLFILFTVFTVAFAAQAYQVDSYLTIESLILENSAMEPTNRTGLAILPLNRFTLAPYYQLELFFLHGETPRAFRWKLGIQGSILLALGDEEIGSCCELDNQDAQLGLKFQFRSGKHWGGSVEYDHFVGHRGADGAFIDQSDTVRDNFIFRGTHHWSNDSAFELVAALFLRDSPRDRFMFWRGGLVQRIGNTRLELGLQFGTDDPHFETARAKLSYWSPKKRPLRFVPYLMALYGDPFFSARQVEHSFALLIGGEIALLVSNK